MTVQETLYGPPANTGYGAGTGLAVNGTNLDNTLLTGVAGGQTIIGDTASAGNLVLKATSHATQGAVIIGSDIGHPLIRQLSISCSTTEYAGIICGQASNANCAIYWTGNASAANARFDISTSSYATDIHVNGRRTFLQDSPLSGTQGVFIGTTTLDTDQVARLVIDCKQTGGTSSAGVKWNGIDVRSCTYTLSGSTNVTTASGVNLCSFGQPTISAGSALTVTAAATVYIADAPVGAGAGPATITSAYALWVDAGATRFDGNVGFFATAPAAQQTSGANLTNNVTSGGTSDQIDNWTNLSTYSTDAAAIRNAVYQLARKLKQVNDGLRAYGLFT